jgi:hypothetical protein
MNDEAGDRLTAHRELEDAQGALSELEGRGSGWGFVDEDPGFFIQGGDDLNRRGDLLERLDVRLGDDKDISKNNLNTEGISGTLLAWGIWGSSGANIERWRVGWTRRRCGFGPRWRRARLGGAA